MKTLSTSFFICISCVMGVLFSIQPAQSQVLDWEEWRNPIDSGYHNLFNVKGHNILSNGYRLDVYSLKPDQRLVARIVDMNGQTINEKEIVGYLSYTPIYINGLGDSLFQVVVKLPTSADSTKVLTISPDLTVNSSVRVEFLSDAKQLTHDKSGNLYYWNDSILKYNYLGNLLINSDTAISSSQGIRVFNDKVWVYKDINTLHSFSLDLEHLKRTYLWVDTGAIRDFVIVQDSIFIRMTISNIKAFSLNSGYPIWKFTPSPVRIPSGYTDAGTSMWKLLTVLDDSTFTFESRTYFRNGTLRWYDYAMPIVTTTGKLRSMLFSNDYYVTTSGSYTTNWTYQYNSIVSHQGFYSYNAVRGDSAYIGRTKHGNFLKKFEINGRIVGDLDSNCILNSGDIPLNDHLLLMASPGNWIATPDSNGVYKIQPDHIGDYKIAVNTTSDLLNLKNCTDTTIVSLTDTSGDTTTANFFIKEYVKCPYMRVSVSIPLFRSGRASSIWVMYANTGTADADSSYVELILDSMLRVTSTSVPYTRHGDVLRFDLGKVKKRSYGVVKVHVILSEHAVIGSFICNQAQVFPRPTCFKPEVYNYSGPFVEARVDYDKDSVYFYVTNTGSGMLKKYSATIYKDDTIAGSFDYKLSAGQTLKRSTPMSPQAKNIGVTYILQAQQSDQVMWNSNPIAFAELPNYEGSNRWLNAVLGDFPMDNGEDWFDMNCGPDDGSWDPNDKRTFPTGFGPEHFVDSTQVLEYQIRFQNTGTDTAFKVRLVDTLSDFLDITSFKRTGASHNHTFRIYGKNVIEWIFDDIKLPDSTTNLEESMGFVKFKVRQKPGNSIGTRIENRAAIFFDYNEPVITNTTYVTVSKDWFDSIDIRISDEIEFGEDYKVKVTPNPARDHVIVTLNGDPSEDVQINIYNLLGKKVMAVSPAGNQQLRIDTRQLGIGIYLLETTIGGKTINVQKFSKN